MQINYRAGAGEIIWAMTTCRPDIAFTSVKLSQSNSAPHQLHYHGLKHTIKYLYDYSEKFEIYTDASESQIGSSITQNRPLAFFSRKLSDTQKRYNTTEKELLTIVETLKEFKGMLWGQSIVVYTDHKNLIYDAQQMSSDRVYRWRLLLEDYGPEIIYI